VIHSGRHDDYFWLASDSPRAHLPVVLASCPELVVGRFVAITSFDSGPLTPSDEERAAGWTFDGRVMYSPRITAATPVPHEQFDEWLVFDEETRELPELEVFINWGGFTLAVEQEQPDHYRELRERLWAQLARVSAESYVGEGDRFLLASSNRAVFECALDAVKRWCAGRDER
jgi:hypothetical protein